MSTLPFPFLRSERIPSPYLVVYAALGLAAGVALGERMVRSGWFGCAGGALTPNPLWLLAPLPVLAGFIAWGRERRRVVIPLVAGGCLLLGVWRYAWHPFEPCLGPGNLAFYHRSDPFDRPTVLEGMISGYPDEREAYNQYRVQVDTLWQGDERLPVAGAALVRTGKETLLQYGDRVRVNGAPTSPPTFPGFDYRRFLARKDIYTLVRRAEVTVLASGQGNRLLAALYAFRARAAGILSALLPRPYAALANGMILGIESGIPSDLYTQFNLTGSSHVIVISGSNIALVSAIFLAVFSRGLGGRKRLAAACTLVGIIAYTLLVGADSAVTRAAIMGGLFVLATAFGQTSVALISLFLAGLVMFLLNPLTLWDVGFQLSFAATLGLILLGQPMQRRWQQGIGRKLPKFARGLVSEGLLITLAAQIATLPLIVYYFGRLSLISLLVNVLILPVQPFILIGGGLSILVGLAWLPLARATALVPHACLWWTVAVVQQGAVIPFASLEIDAFGRFIALVALILYGLTFLWWLLRQEQGATTLLPPAWRLPALRGVTLAGLLILPVWVGAAWNEARPDGRLHIHLLGRERAADFLLVAPNGNSALITTARESPAYPLPTLLAMLPGQRCPQLILVARPAAPAPDLGDCPQSQVLAAGHPALQPGAQITLADGVVLTQLAGGGDEALLFILRYNDFSALLPFENSQETQAALQPETPAGISLLPAPFPGTGAWPQPDLLAHLRPELVLVPQGATYPPSVMARLSQTATAAIANDAATEITTDGRSFRLTTRPYPQDDLTP